MSSFLAYASYLSPIKDGVMWVVGNSQNPTPTPPPVLDPMTVLIQIALLGYKEKGTRLRIARHHIDIQERSSYDFGINVQGGVRRFQSMFLSGASREDLDVLKTCIIKSAKWHKPHELENIKKLFLHARYGLKALIMTYKGTSKITCDAIKTWKAIIDESCEQPIEDEEPLSHLAHKVKNLWSVNEIDSIIQLLDNARSKQGVIDPSEEIKCTYEIKAIEALLEGKTTQFRACLQEAAQI